MKNEDIFTTGGPQKVSYKKKRLSLFLGLWKTWKTWKCPGIPFNDLETLEIACDFVIFFPELFFVRIIISHLIMVMLFLGRFSICKIVVVAKKSPGI